MNRRIADGLRRQAAQRRITWMVRARQLTPKIEKGTDYFASSRGHSGNACLVGGCR